MGTQIPKIAVAGLFHETNTFLKARTGLGEFERYSGLGLLEQKGKGNPIAGYIDAAERFGWEILPTCYFRARPSGLVEDPVVEVFWQEVSSKLDGREYDGILLALHGAMVSESYEDVEGEVLGRLRRLVGPHMPIFGVLDLHANFSPAMSKFANCLIAYRRNPHTDAYETAERAASLLESCLKSGDDLPQMSSFHSRRIYPAIHTGTEDEPMKSLERKARELESIREGVLAVNILAGFAHSDTAEAGLSFCIVHSATESGSIESAFLELQRIVENVRTSGPEELPLPEAVERIEGDEFPVVLVESSDNVGGGAPGDGTSVLEALLKASEENAIAVIRDPAAVDELHGKPEGSIHRLLIGGKGGELGAKPLELELELLRSTDGQFELEDPHSHLASSVGMRVNMGPCAVVRCGGVTILLTSKPTPPFDLGQLRSQGIAPEKSRVIVVKAAVAYQQAYNRIAKRHYFVDTEGPCSSKLERLPYRNLRRPIWPLD